MTTSFTSAMIDLAAWCADPAGGGPQAAGVQANVMQAVCMLWVFMLIGAVIVGIGMWGALTKQRQVHEIYQRLAASFSGSAESGGWMRRPQAWFPWGPSSVVVESYSTGGKNPAHYTRIHFRWRQPIVRCEVYPEGMWSRVGKLVGMPDVEIGVSDFDQRYVIKGSSPAALRDLLNDAVRARIDELRQFLSNGDIYVSFGSHELLVKKRSYITQYPTLMKLVELAIRLHDEVLLAAEKGIEFVKDAPPPKLSEAVCQICGEPIKSDVVFCRRCRTPHHQECWEYYGGCSTYGCQETKFLRPKSRRARSARKKMQQ